MLKEVPFEHEGREYVLVIQILPHRFEKAKRFATHNKGTVIPQCTMYDMTAFREKHNGAS